MPCRCHCQASFRKGPPVPFLVPGVLVTLFLQRQLEHALSMLLPGLFPAACPCSHSNSCNMLCRCHCQAPVRKGSAVSVLVPGAPVPTAPAGACPVDVTARPLSVRVRLCPLRLLGQCFPHAIWKLQDIEISHFLVFRTAGFHDLQISH
jgi:hypothetical protein